MFSMFRVVVIIALSVWTLSSYAEISVRLEREEIHINETVRLVIESNSAGESQPDLSVLEQHFNILARSSGQNVSIINGAKSVTRRWTIELEPKSVGSFGLEPIVVGAEQSRRLRISVLPESTSASTGAEVFLEVEADADSIYVQQQLLLTVKLFLRTRLLDGSLSDPEPNGAVVRRIGQDVRYETRRADITYGVFERRYAVFPQQSGVLEIPAFQFQGIAEDPGQNNQQMFNSLFNQGKRIRASSPAVQVTVKPPAPIPSGGPWLPAKKVQIEQVGQQSDEFEVGQPVTLKIQLQSLGLTAEQLPEIIIPETPGLRFYPDQGVLETQDNGEDVIGIQLKSIAVIPNQSGGLTLPELVVTWWNTETDSVETARLPQRKILVKEAAATVSSGNMEDESTVSDSAVSSIQAASGDRPAQSRFWKWLALGSLGLWLISVVIMFLIKLRKKTRRDSGPVPPTPSNNEWRRRLQAACRVNDPVNARAALIGWGRDAYGSALTLEQIATQTEKPELAEEILNLDLELYSTRNGGNGWQGEGLWKLFSSFRPDNNTESNVRSNLQPLYP
jgi:hypothetical protein